MTGFGDISAFVSRWIDSVAAALVNALSFRSRKTVPDSWLRLTITEGRNRQVRRMTAAVGHPTLRLIRWSVGDWTLDGLAPGEWRRV